jgi:thiamine transport system ATP-binding protein
MFQDGQLFNHQSVARNVGYPLRLRREPRGRIAQRVGELLRLVGLPDAGDRMPDTLSGGERQRVALARALAVDPRLLLLDEPLSALDRDLRETLAGQLREILVASGTTTVMVTHDQEEAFAVADHLGVMRDGRLVQAGPVAEVWQRPVDAWTARFLGYATVLTGEAARRVTGSADQVALRRSALRVDPAGQLAGRVLSARSGPDQTRLEIEVASVGRLDAVAPPGVSVRIGGEVSVSLDTSRVARIPRTSA